MVKIHDANCIKCDKCIEECRSVCISRDEKTSNIIINNDYCVECGHCYAICPSEAISMEGKPYSATSFLTETIISRRSCRKYKDEPVSDGDIAKIIQIANYAPSATNQKKAEVIVVRNKNMLNSIKEITKNVLLDNFAMINNPLTSIPARFFLGKSYKRIKRYKELMTPVLKSDEKDILLFNAPCFIVVHMDPKTNMPDEDSHYVAYNMILLAEQLGLSTCIMGFARRALNTKEGKKLLDIPDNHSVYTCFVLGHSDVKYLRNIPQKEIKVKFFG